MHRRQFIATTLGFAALIAAIPAEAAEPKTPQEIVTFLYVFSAGKNNKWEGGSAFFDEGVQKKHFSKNLIDLMKAEAKASDGDIGALDYDPISDSQDPAVFNLKIAPGEASEAKARIVATFTREKKPTSVKQTINYDFVPENGGWKLHDIVIPGTGTAEDPDRSVRAALEESIKDFEKAKAAPAKP